MNSYLTIFLTSAIGLACATGQIQAPVQPDPGLKTLRLYSTWTAFLHPRYGFEIPIPPGVGTSGKPEEETEPQFISADGTFVMSAWGGLTYELPSKVLTDKWNAATRKANRKITYQKQGKTWFVVSGTDVRGIEFYEKFTMNGQHVAFLNITFPQSKIRQYERWVEQIEDGFRPVSLPLGPPETPPQLTSGVAEAVVVAPPTEREISTVLAETSSVPKQNTIPTERPLMKPTETRSTPLGELPTALPVVGKPGYVYSPYSEKHRLVDVKGMPSGAKVKCPYTMKNFRLP